ncbi:MAG: glycoside hydrolase family 27 protein [Paucibacter sp.]|nr:glycoside hydrolase family 27 protein [Roseateles sp.]
MTLFRSLHSRLLLCAAGLGLALCAHAAPAAKVAATPPMGWNSWNHFAEKIDDATVRAQADAMVASGMRDAGYTYINIDDTWEGERDAKGEIHPNAKFPDMKALADYVHAKGLKLGIYSSPGPKTCAGFEGSYGHEEQDARTYAAWGIDYLKYDLCSLGEQLDRSSPLQARQIMRDAYVKMHKALLATGRPIVFSLCQYGYDSVWHWGASVGGNAWRTTGDITDTYDRMAEIGFGQAGLSKYAGPGHWNDPDMLEVGNGGMKPEEYRTHMALWALLSAPLLAGNDLRQMSPETVALLTNRDLIAIDQDPAGHQGDRVAAEGTLEVWAKDMADGSKIVALFNRSDIYNEIGVDFRKLGYAKPVKAIDVWSHKDLGRLPLDTRMLIQGHDVILLRVKP